MVERRIRRTYALLNRLRRVWTVREVQRVPIHRPVVSQPQDRNDRNAQQELHGDPAQGAIVEGAIVESAILPSPQRDDDDRRAHHTRQKPSVVTREFRTRQTPGAARQSAFLQLVFYRSARRNSAKYTTAQINNAR